MSVTLISSGATQGYQARCGRARAGMTRFFSTKKYGKRRAPALAKQAEAEMFRLHPKHEKRTVANANSTSGVIGIGLRTLIDAAGRTRLTVQAAWSDGDRSRSTSYSVARHGKLGATELAMRARESGAAMRYAMSARQVWQLLSRKKT